MIEFILYLRESQNNKYKFRHIILAKIIINIYIHIYYISQKGTDSYTYLACQHLKYIIQNRINFDRDITCESSNKIKI